MAIRNAIADAAHGATFCGPDQNPSPDLDRAMARDLAKRGLVEITQHSYPFGSSYKNPSIKNPAQLVPVDAAKGREEMLSPAAYETYDEIRKGITNYISGTALQFRLSETNSFWYSGLAGASDRYASALWSVDYLHWWILHGADGLNFHTGDRTGGLVTLPCRYAAFVTTPNGYEARPLAYGLMLFHLGAKGGELRVHVSTTPEKGLIAYATLAEDGTISVTVINKTHGDDARKLRARVLLGSPLASPEAMAIFLTARGGNIAADSSEVSLGGAQIQPDGSWSGHWAPVKADQSKGIVAITMPPASAVVIRATAQRDSRDHLHRY